MGSRDTRGTKGEDLEACGEQICFASQAASSALEVIVAATCLEAVGSVHERRRKSHEAVPHQVICHTQQHCATNDYRLTKNYSPIPSCTQGL